MVKANGVKNLRRGGTTGKHAPGAGRPPSEVLEIKKNFTLDNMPEAQKSFDRLVYLRDNGSTEAIQLDAAKTILDRLLGRPVTPVGDGGDGLSDLGKILRERYKVSEGK